jgi:hypothetical protein
MKTTFDHTRYKKNKTSKKLNQRIFEERREQADWHKPILLQIGSRKLSLLEAKDNTEMMLRAEMHNRSMALTEKIINDDLDYTRLTITFATKNRLEHNFYGSEKTADDFLHKQNDSISHFIESIYRRYKKATGEELMYKYNIEVQLKSGVNLHAHIIFYHPKDTRKTIALCEIISQLRYAIKNKKIKKKKKTVDILGVGRLYLQMHIYHQDEICEYFGLSGEREIYTEMKMCRDADATAANYASLDFNKGKHHNFIAGSWVWFSFLDTDDMAQMHAEQDQYDNKSQLAHTPTELYRHISHDTKALMQTDGKDATKTKMNAQEIVKQINYNDWCKNYVNNAILEDLGIRRIRTSNNLLFPIDTYRRCRRQLLSHDERYESIYYATKLHENREITIEKNLLFTSILDTASGEVIAQCNKAQRGK